MKLPFLLSHYIDHKNVSGEMTFIDFLFQHYQEETMEDTHDPDFAADSKLPFKADEGIHNHIAPFILNSGKKSIVLIPESVIFIEVKYVPVFTFLPQIWQPPRNI